MFTKDFLVGAEAKNLFLTNKKGNFHCIVTASQDTSFKLNDLRDIIGAQYPEGEYPHLKCGKLQFAKEKVLNERLKLITGSVTPFGVLNDDSKETVLFLDKALLKKKLN